MGVRTERSYVYTRLNFFLTAFSKAITLKYFTSATGLVEVYFALNALNKTYRVLESCCIYGSWPGESYSTSGNSFSHRFRASPTFYHSEAR